MAKTKTGRSPTEKNGEKIPDTSSSLIGKFAKVTNGETVPDMEFSQTHKFHEDNFLDTVFRVLA
ncbi:hypothetical protein A2U01_0065098 [Trifolium medium]|uniref:Uncharacterized protein n=1 Tax=Trifolium medium TaxID=97028 RepID=A0A392S791_9FABA|nr:hypothetical protein [Trifolium medium]